MLKDLLEIHPLPWRRDDFRVGLSELTTIRNGRGDPVFSVGLNESVAIDSRTDPDGSEVTTRRYVPRAGVSAAVTAAVAAPEALQVLHDLCHELDQRDFSMAEASCPDCTAGTTPNDLNKGPCAWHRAQALLKRFFA